MTDLILILVLAALIGGAGWYVYRAKKSGAKCIGCPHSESCGKNSCNCH